MWLYLVDERRLCWHLSVILWKIIFWSGKYLFSVFSFKGCVKIFFFVIGIWNVNEDSLIFSFWALFVSVNKHLWRTYPEWLCVLFQFSLLLNLRTIKYLHIRGFSSSSQFCFWTTVNWEIKCLTFVRILNKMRLCDCVIFHFIQIYRHISFHSDI